MAPLLCFNTASFLLHIVTLACTWGSCPPQPVSLLGHAPSPSPSSWLAQAIFKPNHSPYKYPNNLIPGYSSCFHPLWRWNRRSVLKCQHIKFIHWGITQKKEYNMLYNVVKFEEWGWWNNRHKFICSLGFFSNLHNEVLWFVDSIGPSNEGWIKMCHAAFRVCRSTHNSCHSAVLESLPSWLSLGILGLEFFLFSYCFILT